jgi:hypothetical protein
VELEYDGRKKAFRVRDNGHGVADMRSLLTIGGHASKGGIGRYGIGFNDAVLWLGGKTKVTSVHKGQRWIGQADWFRMRSWKEVAITHQPNTGDSFTEVLCLGIGRRFKEGHERFMETLGFTYSPRIRSGTQITFQVGKNRKVVAAWELPPMEEPLELHGATAKGRKFRIRGGIVKAGEKNRHPGFILSYRDRYISTGIEACREYSPRRFVAVVDLEPSDWRLSTNKTTVAQADDDLYPALYTACEDVLRRAHEAAQEHTFDALRDSTNRVLGELLEEHKKQKRKPKTRTGKHEAAGTDRQIRRVRQSQPGSKKLRTMLGGKLCVDFDPDQEELATIEVNAQVVRVMFASTHPYVQAMCQGDERAWYGWVLSFVSEYLARHDTLGQRLFPGIGEYDSFEGFSAIMADLSAALLGSLGKQTKQLRMVS